MARTKVKVYRRRNILVRVRKLRDKVFAYEVAYLNPYNHTISQIILVPKRTYKRILLNLPNRDYREIVEATGQGGIDERGRIYFLPSYYTRRNVSRIKQILLKHKRKRRRR